MMSTAADPRAATRSSWRRRAKQFIGLHLRQVTCLHTLVDALPHTFRFWRRQQYQTLGQQEEDDGAEKEDRRQAVNRAFGQVLSKVAVLCMVGIAVDPPESGDNMKGGKSLEEMLAEGWLTRKDFAAPAFHRDSHLVGYLGALELLICSACFQTAAAMYTRRRHALRHPQGCGEREQARYIRVDLRKEPGCQGRQQYGLGFRPSSDGLECLLIEDIRPGSLLDLWNQKAARGAALPPPAESDGGQGAPAQQQRLRVHPGAAVVAVNDVTADIGMMQLELRKAAVTLWIRSEVYHPSQLESEVLDTPDPVVSTGPVMDVAPASELHFQQKVEQGSEPGPTFLGRPNLDPDEVEPIVEPTAIAGPLCACVTYEDEEPQILMRWLVYSVLLGWVTLLPVVFMQPHEERPRQHLLRQYLLKPGVLIMPLWFVLRIWECMGFLFPKIRPPFFHLMLVHMFFPAVLVWFLMKLQAADEALVLEQRRNRQAEVEKTGKDLQPVAVEDASPTLLKEFITVNPVALVWLGAVAAVPILVASMLTPMKTERARLAQGFVHMVYGPLIILQVFFAQVIHNTEFKELPRLYLACLALMLSIPCFMIWCCCLMCATRYGRQDMALVHRQRLERARAVFSRATATQTLSPGAMEAASGPAPPVATPSDAELVDLTEAWQREWEYISTA